MIGPQDQPVKETGEKVDIAPGNPVDQAGVFRDHELETLHLARALGMENLKDIHKNQHQFDRLMEWAQAKGAKDSADLVWQVKQLANRIGSPTIGNNWAQHLATYAYLELERMKVDNQLREMEGGGSHRGR